MGCFAPPPETAEGGTKHLATVSSSTLWVGRVFLILDSDLKLTVLSRRSKTPWARQPTIITHTASRSAIGSGGVDAMVGKAASFGFALRLGDAAKSARTSVPCLWVGTFVGTRPKKRLNFCTDVTCSTRSGRKVYVCRDENGVAANGDVPQRRRPKWKPIWVPADCTGQCGWRQRSRSSCRRCSVQRFRPRHRHSQRNCFAFTPSRIWLRTRFAITHVAANHLLHSNGTQRPI